MRKLTTAAALALALAAAPVMPMAGQAGAHKPDVTASVQRPCGPQAPWSGTVTVSSDADYGKDWQNKYRIGLVSSDVGVFTALSPLVDDQIDYVIDVPGIPAGTASVVVDTRSRWQNKNGVGGVVGPIPGSITLLRPAATECEQPTTTTTVPPTTTTTPPSDTTVPAEPPAVLIPPLNLEAPPASDVYVGELPRTGMNGQLVLAAAGCFAAGALLIAGSRRRLRAA